MKALGKNSHWKNWKKIAVSAGILFALTSVGCGRASEDGGAGVVPPPVGSIPGSSTVNSCGNGTFSIGGSPCFWAPDFNSACWSYGGAVVPLNGTQYCKISIQVDAGFGGYGAYSAPFTVLNPGYPAGGYSTNFRLRRGDKLSYSGSGTWGNFQYDTSCLFDSKWFKLCGTSIDTDTCSDYGVDGAGAPLNLGQPAGLMGSDGVEVFFLGKEISAAAPKVINNDGLLRIGFNAPASNNLCAKADGHFTVTRCEDAQGRSYQCP
ncbi:MAG: hypothetical protein NDJ89_13460 [Oligoflexia bacterium]|nr:hypothetical protein [Oligoflexia bacterium]